MVNSTIFQIVGFQDSGKTTFIKRLIEGLQEVNLNAVTIKHHGHGGKPVFHEEKDSAQHIKAGAIASIVEGGGHLLLQADKNNWSLDEKIELISFFKPDIILIEGHKYEDFQKAVIIRSDEDLPLLKDLTHIKVIYYWEQTSIESFTTGTETPSFSIHDPSGYSWLIDFLKNTQKTSE
jgi:molybdopterin-guanine dinucleotide biosynthesis adapter protein